jgi:glycosyltransferase involved in cell wall biosynthesis
MATPVDGDPLVAVVTPVYNGDPYLARTLACVQAQTYKNLVHIVLDNASTDGTQAAIAAAEGGQVTLITRRNPVTLPPTDNWNEAVAMIPPRARYAKILCADDLMRADCIERLVAVAESEPNVEFVTAVDIFDDRLKPHGLDQTRAVYDGREILLWMFRGRIQWLPAHHLFFRVTPERLTKPFDPNAFPAADMDFVFRLLREGNAGFVNAPLFYTRRHQATQTVQIGGDFNFIYTGFQRLHRYGYELLSPDEIANIRRAMQWQVVRHVIAWQLAGRRKLVKEHLCRLDHLGFKPNALDYATAVLTWPRHKLRNALRKIINDRITLPKADGSQFPSVSS